MPTLPVSVRLAVWATAAFHGRLDLDEAVARAHPDLDHWTGDLGRLQLWRDLGESAVLVALPRPGDLTGMPRAHVDVSGAAAARGECAYVAGMGGLLVPTLSSFGPEGDEGTAAEWTAYDSEPVARHVLESISLGDLERALAHAITESASSLEEVEGRPWSSQPREDAERRLGEDRWGLPRDLAPRAVRLIGMAARIGVIADEGLRLASAGPALDLHSSTRRESGLRSLQSAADAALAGAANVAVMEVAGWRPA